MIIYHIGLKIDSNQAIILQLVNRNGIGKKAKSRSKRITVAKNKQVASPPSR